MPDPFRLERFVAAQNGRRGDTTYASALAEVCAGRKVSHWMWYVFPQIAGLGSSAYSREYAVSGLDEARAFLAHPVLGSRLLEITRAIAGPDGRSAEEIFGFDAVKLHSSMTLFGRADSGQSLFQQVLDRCFGGRPDEATLARL